MSKTIDEQVVKLTFDNRGFESNANKSATTLGRVKDAAEDLKNVIGVGLSSALQRLNVTDLLKVGGLAGGLTLLKKGINELEAPIKRVSDMATNAIENTLKSAMNQIKNGGWSRAQKIDNAKFMLKGLGLDEKTFMEAADWAVSGTAYTLDAAASAAAQFGASGYKDLEQLKYMLRSISGVAAMTNRDFEEISYLWTQMAGLGRVTGMTLTSLSMKGINAAKVLADAIGKTEEEVKDMVHDGQIDFDTFASAMDKAFGEHAKDANSTFSGATANIRAALSKLGADFFSIILSSENFNNALNSVRETLNAIRDVTKPIAEGIWVSAFDLFAIDFHDAILEVKEILDGGEFFKGLTILQEFNKVLEWMLDKAKSLLGIISHIVAFNDNMYFARIGNAIALVAEQVRVLVDEIIGVFDRSFNWFKIAESFRGRIVSFIQDIANGFKFSGTQISNIRYFISQIIKLGKRLGSTFANVFNINKFRPVDVVKEFVSQLTKLISKLTLSDKAIEGIDKAATGLFRVFKLIFDAATEIVSFLWPIVLDIIPGLLDGIAQISGWLGQLAINATDLLTNSDAMKTVWEQIKTVIQNIVDISGRIGTSFFDLFFGGEEGTGKSFFKRVSEFGTELGDILNDAAKMIDVEGIDFSPIKDLFNNLFNFGFGDESELDKAAKDGEKSLGIIDKIIGYFQTSFQAMQEQFGTGAAGGQLPFELPFGKSGKDSFLGKPLFDIIDAYAQATNGMNEKQLDLIKAILLKVGDVVMTIIITLGAVLTSANITSIAKSFGKDFTQNIEDAVNGLNAIVKTIGSTDLAKSFKSVEGAEKVLNAGNIVNFIEAIAKTVLAIAALIVVVQVLDVKASDVGLIAGVLGATMGIITICVTALAIISRKLSTKSRTAFRFNGKGGTDNSKQLRLTDKLAQGAGGALVSIFDFARESEEGPFGDISKALLTIAGGMFLISASIAVLRFGMGGPDGIKKTWIAVAMLSSITVVLTALLGGVSILGMLLQRKGDLPGEFETKMLAIAGSLALVGLSMTMISASLIALTFVDQERVLTAAGIMGVLVGALTAIFGLIGALVVDPKAAIVIGVSGLSVLAAFSGVALVLFNVATAVGILATIDKSKLEDARKTMVTLSAVILGITAGIGAIIAIVSAINPAAGAMGAIGLVAFGFALIEVAAAALMLAGAISIAMSASEKLAVSVGKLWTSISNLFNMLSSDYVGEKQLNAFKDNFANVAVSVFQGWSKGIMEGIHYIAEHYKDYSGDIRKIFETIITAIPKLMADARGNGDSESVMDLFMDILIPNRPHSVAEFLDRLQPIWEQQVLPAIDSFLNLISPQLNDIVKRLCDTIVVFSVTNAPIIASSAVETFLIWVKAFDDAIQRDKDQIKEAVTSLLNTLGDLANEIIFDSNIWNKITSIGSNVITGIKNGMMQALHDIPFTNALLSIGSTIYNTVCSSLGIESPSKVMKQVGDFVMQGLGIGIEEGKSGLNTTLDGLLETFTGFGDNISGVFDKFDFKITPELDTSLIDGGLSGLKDTIGNFDMTNIGSIMSTRDRMNAMPNVNDLLDATNAKMSDLLGTVYSIDQSKMNTQPINIDVALEGDTSKFFKAMVKENHRYTLANGASAF